MELDGHAEEYKQTKLAVERADFTAREQLRALCGEQSRLYELLHERETDLTQIRTLIDDSSYGGTPPGSFDIAYIGSEQLESLQEREQEIQAAIELLTRAISRISILISTMSDILQSDSRRPRNRDKTALLMRVQGRETERSRLAREIHDGPAQVLANTLLGLERCQIALRDRPGQLGGQLQKLEADISNGLREVRRFIFDLQPIELERSGLVHALKHYLAEYSEQSGIRTHLEVQGGVELMTAEQQRATFRVIQEALQNSRKHAHATLVNVSMQRQNRRIVVQVKDNGMGFDAGRSTSDGSHYGVRSMRERAEAINADLSVESAPGEGTAVTMSFTVIQPGVH